MKDSFSIAIFVAAAAAIGFRLYKKYYGRSAGFQKTDGKKSSPMASSSKEEEYEPYSKK